MDELKPCPFCLKNYAILREDEKTRFNYVYCTVCGASSGMQPSEKPAIEAWSRRGDK